VLKQKTCIVGDEMSLLGTQKSLLPF